MKRKTSLIIFSLSAALTLTQAYAQSNDVGAASSSNTITEATSGLRITLPFRIDTATIPTQASELLIAQNLPKGVHYVDGSSKLGEQHFFITFLHMNCPLQSSE